MATYYVDGNANNDSGDGSSNRPWKTLSKAADQTLSLIHICRKTSDNDTITRSITRLAMKYSSSAAS